MKFTKGITATIFASALLSLSTGAQSEAAFPNKPVTIILSNAAGSQADLLARQLIVDLGSQWGQPVIIEYKLGASGMIAGDHVAKSPADGYTILMGSSGVMAITPNLYPKIPFNAIKDFVPLHEIGSADTLLVVPNTSGKLKLQSLIAKAKSSKVPLAFGSLGSGSTHNIAGQQFGKAAGIDVAQIPYKSEGQLITDLASGRLDFAVLPLASTMSFLKAGRLSAVAVLAKERSKFLPDVPTTAELGLQGVEMVQWFGFFAPAAIPTAVLEKITTSVSKALGQKNVQTGISNLAIEPGKMNQAEFTKFFHQQYADYGKKIKTLEIKID